MSAIPPQDPPPGVSGDSAPAASPSAPKRHGFRRGLRWAGATFLLILVALLLTAQFFLREARLARLLSEQLSSALGTPVTLRVQRRGLHEFELLDLAVGADSLGLPFLQVERLGLYPRPAFLFDRRIHLDSLVVQGLRLNLAWRDSLLLPAWLGLGDSTAVEDSSAGDPLRHLALLADHDWQVDGTRILVRDLRLGLAGEQSGAPLALASPPLQLSLDLPRLGPGALRSLSRHELPPDLLAHLLLDWSGTWRERAAGGALRPLPLPPDLRQSLLAAGVDLERHPELLQGVDLKLALARDTLRLGARLKTRPRDLALRWEKRELPLPERLEMGFELAWPVRVNPLRAHAAFDLELEGSGLELSARGDLELRQQSGGWRVEADWSQHLDSRLAELASLGGAVGLPALRGDLALGLKAGLELELDSQFVTGSGHYHEELLLDSRRLGLPDQGLELEDLHLSQSLAAGLDLADPLPREPRLRLKGKLGRARLGLAPLEDPRELDIDLRLSGGAARDSLELAADLGVAHWQQGRLDLSVFSRLPSLAEWTRDAEAWSAHPERLQDLPLQVDLVSSQLRLEGLDPGLSGGLRVSAQVKGGRGLDFWLEAVPGGLRLDAAGQRLDLPLHRLELEGHARLGPLDAPIPWPDTLWAELRPDPLPPMTLQLGRQGQRARLRQSWKGFDLPRLLAMLPEAWRPAEVEVGSGRASLESDLLLGEDALPLKGSLGLELSGLEAGVPGYGVEGLDLRLDLAVDSLGVEYLISGSGSTLSMREPSWSWEGLSLAGSGRVEASLATLLGDSLWLEPGRGGPWPADLTLELGLRSLNLQARLKAEMADWRRQRPDELELQASLGGAGQARPWPGLRFTGRLGLDQRVRSLGGGWYRTEGRLHAQLDSLAWQSTVSLEKLVLDLPFTQELQVEPVVGLASDRRRSPLDWSGLRGWDRRLPDFGPAPGASEGRAGEGWALRIAHARYEAWSVEALMVDLRPGQGRLDIPEFRFGLFGGGVSGSAEVVGLDSTRYALDCSLIGLDSRYFEFGDRLGGRKGRKGGLVHAVLNLEGQGLDLEALDQLRGQLRMPDLDRQVTLNLLRALDAQGVDPSIGRIRRLLELPGFRYRVERVEFDVAHGFARPRVSLKKSPFSPLPDVAIPMSPLPLGFMVRNFALAGEESP